MQRTGTAEVTCDAFGKLLLPKGVTHDNVIRIKTIMEYGDFQNNTELIHYSEARYQWFNDVEQTPLLTIITTDFAGVVTTIISSLISTNTATNETTKFSAFNVSPNPASNSISLNIENQIDQSSDLSLEIYNQMGQQVQSEPILQNIQLNIEELVSGLHYIVLKEKGKIVGREKFLVL